MADTTDDATRLQILKLRERQLLLQQQAPPGGQPMRLDIVKPQGEPAMQEAPMPSGVQGPTQPGGVGVIEWLPGFEFLQPLPPATQEHVVERIQEQAPAVGQFAAEAGGGLAGQIAGATLGGVVAGPPGAAVGRVVGGATGATIGNALTRKATTGDLPGIGEIAGEFALNLVPETMESVGRAALRGLARSTKAAQVIRFHEAARQARQLPEATFQPLPLDQIRPMFEQVRQSGVRVGVGDTTQYLQTISPGKQRALMEEIAHIDRLNKTGGRFAQLADGMRQGRVVGLDIGQAQQLSSELRKRLEGLESFEARQLLRDFRQALDEDIFSGVARGRVPAGGTPALLETARREYARNRAAQEMSDLIERKITSTPDLQMNTFNLRSFADELRRGTSEISRDINRALDLTPGARERFLDGLDNLSRLYNTIEVSLADVTGFRRYWVVAGLGQMLSLAMLTDSGQRLFRQAVLEGRGALSINGLALAANAARHELGLGIQPSTQPLHVGTQR